MELGLFVVLGLGRIVVEGEREAHMVITLLDSGEMVLDADGRKGVGWWSMAPTF